MLKRFHWEVGDKCCVEAFSLGGGRLYGNVLLFLSRLEGGFILSQTNPESFSSRTARGTHTHFINK